MNANLQAMRAALILFLTAVAQHLHAQAPAYSDFIAPVFSGTTASSGWFNLNSSAYPGYGFPVSNTAWPSPITANQSGSTGAVLNKTGGSGYLASNSTNAIYSMSRGNFTVADAAPVASLQNVLFQVGTTTNLGSAGVLLEVNGSGSALPPTESMLVSSRPITAFGNNATYSVWAFQWDLSALGQISSLNANWNTTSIPGHELIYGARLDQSSIYTKVVPEPGTWAFLAFAAVALPFWVAAKKRRAAN